MTLDCPKWPASSRITSVLLLVLWQMLGSNTLQAAPSITRVQVVEPYLELHTGPGGGFPVFFVVDRGEWINVLKRRTDWYKIRTMKGKEGWVHRAQLERTLTTAGQKTRFRDILLQDYLSRKTGIGFGWGLLAGDNMLVTRLGYHINPRYSLEFGIGQAAGAFSSTTLLHLDLLSHPYAKKRLAPFVVLGVGSYHNVPKATLVGGQETRSIAANAGAGIQYYITRRFILRADLRDYLVFIDDNRSDEYVAMTVGVSVFF